MSTSADTKSEQNWSAGPEERRRLESFATDSDLSPPRGNPFPVVGIGASAGGLEAFGQLLEALPEDTGMVFVLVQHLDPKHESLLPELLAPHTSMPVVSASEGAAIKPNQVYVIPPNTSMELTDGTLHLATREPGLHLPIDIFFMSLARVQGSRAIGVVLSGNASDGSNGVRAIKAECGITFAQDEASARFGGMPHNAVVTGAIDYVLPPARIAQELGLLAKHPFLIPSRAGDAKSETLPDGDGELSRIFEQLQGRTGVDFSRYKPTTVTRRMGRRMMMLRMHKLSDYARYLEQHPAEIQDLYQDLLISVTSFFRDPGSFDALRELLTAVLQSRPKEEAVRIWVPGCATGEEVYSLAICVCEMLEEHKVATPIQIFGTDISDLALERARQAFYASSIEEDVGADRLSRFFTRVDHGYQISKRIRESCIFAHHNVASDPPFSNLDLISCRNLLIYLDQWAQSRVLPVFHYALKAAGLLLLGSAESTTAAAELFATVDQEHKIYSRKPGAPRLPLEIQAGRSRREQQDGNATGESSTLELQRRLERVIQSKYAPDAVLINAEYQIIQFRGHTSAYLDPAPGQASLNVLRLANEELVVPLRRAVQASMENNETVRETDVQITSAPGLQQITLEVTPVPGAAAGERYFLIVFAPQRWAARTPGDEFPASPLSDDEQVAKLQKELAETREYLRTLSEEHGAYSEELRAASEEARSSNEELQSTNEELRTTKEELQSANEELTTVNEELRNRNQEVNATNSDLKNLLSAVTIPILIVDSELRVRRFNTAAGKLFELGPVDIGRPVRHLRGSIETPGLEQQARHVIDSLHAASEELQDDSGCWYALNIRPYRTLDDHISGAVITLQDIDPLKRALQVAEEARDYAEGMIETVREPLVVLNSDLRVERATQSFYDSFLVSREETQGRLLYDLGSGQWNDPRLRELIGTALFRSEPFHDFEVKCQFPHIGQRTMRLNGRRIPFPQSRQGMLLLSIEDVTERREIAELRFLRLFETAKDGILVVNAETKALQDVNPFLLELTGHTREELVGKQLGEVSEKLGLGKIREAVEEAGEDGTLRYTDVEVRGHDGSRVAVDVIGNAYRVGAQRVIQFNIRDVSLRKQATQALRDSEQRFRLFVESVRDYALFQMDTKGIILSWNAGAERLLGWTEREAVGQHAAIIFTPEDRAKGGAEDELSTARAEGRSEDERWHIRKNGERFFASGILTQVCDEKDNMIGFAKVMRDVTARKEQEEQLKKSLSEKETLVQEIHHRVKNNLQVIVSLLSIQSRHTNDPHVLAAFAEAESRLRAIAHIHERLYASDDLTEVEFAGYVTGLAQELVQLHAQSPEQIRLEVNVADMVLHIERAIPLGLIANELILNSLKHGLQGGSGCLTVNLSYLPGTTDAELGNTLDSGWAKLEICDTGPGMPAGFEIAKSKSLGLRLVRMLVRQLRGQLEIEKADGARTSVSFPLEMNEELQKGSIDWTTGS